MEYSDRPRGEHQRPRQHMERIILRALSEQDEGEYECEYGLSGNVKQFAEGEWEPVHDALLRLPPATSCQDAGTGRRIVNGLLAANPPPRVLEAALAVYPDALVSNPAAFFAACKHAPGVLSLLARHAVRARTRKSDCPYPWILSDHISVEGAQALMEACPEGVLQGAASLAGLCPLDYFLLSPSMIAQRSYHARLWNKFKLMLLAAECSEMSTTTGRRTPSPVHVMLKRVFAHPDFFVNPQLAHHILWILHMLRCSDPWIFQRTAGDDQGYPLHLVLSYMCQNGGEASIGASRELIKILLEGCPESPKHLSASGRSALHMAIENGWPCLDLLLALHPDALNEVDPATGLFPFQSSALYDACRTVPQAAISPSYSPSLATAPTPPTEEPVNVFDINVTFGLLRASPLCAMSARTRVDTQA